MRFVQLGLLLSVSFLWAGPLLCVLPQAPSFLPHFEISPFLPPPLYTRPEHTRPSTQEPGGGRRRRGPPLRRARVGGQPLSPVVPRLLPRGHRAGAVRVPLGVGRARRGAAVVVRVHGLRVSPHRRSAAARDAPRRVRRHAGACWITTKSLEFLIYPSLSRFSHPAESNP